jgi:hypothetical protein
MKIMRRESENHLSQAFLGDRESKEFSLWLWELLKCVETKRPFVDRPSLHDQGPIRLIDLCS